MTITSAETFQLAGVQFNDTDGKDMLVAKFLTPSVSTWVYDPASDYAENPTWKEQAPMIEIPIQGGGYDYYYYVTSAWDDAAQDCTPEGVPVWCDSFGMKVDPVVAPGVGFWLKSNKLDAEGKPATGCSFTVAGAVPSDKPVSRSGSEFVLAAIPAPIEIALDDARITWNGLTPVQVYDPMKDYEENPLWKTTAPMIEIPLVGGGYDYCYYVTSAWDDAAQDCTPEGVAVWCDPFGMKISPVVPAGAGIWFKVQNAGAGNFGFSLADVTK